MNELLRGRALLRYSIAAAIVLVIGAIFVQREILADEGEVALGLVEGAGSAGLGKPAPDFVLNVLDGEPVRLSDFRGQTVVLNFWASWCPPCRAEMPEFQALWEERGPSGSNDLVILAVDFLPEDSVSAAAGFVEDFELTFPILFDTEDGEVYQGYGLRGPPRDVLHRRRRDHARDEPRPGLRRSAAGRRREGGRRRRVAFQFSASCDLPGGW